MKQIKQILAIAALVGTHQLAKSQSVGISSTVITPDNDALMELRSTTKGVLLPRMTQAEINTFTTAANGGSGLGAAEKGMTVFNTTTNRYKYWDGVTWQDIVPGGLQAIDAGNGLSVNNADPTLPKVELGGDLDQHTQVRANAFNLKYVVNSNAGGGRIQIGSTAYNPNDLYSFSVERPGDNNEVRIGGADIGLLTSVDGANEYGLVAQNTTSTGGSQSFAVQGTMINLDNAEGALALYRSGFGTVGVYGSVNPGPNNYSGYFEGGKVFSASNLGIGVTSPSQMLDVNGDINVAIGQGFRVNNGATAGQYLRGNGTRFVPSTIQAADVPAGVVTADNGLNVNTGNNVRLGGQLLANTDIPFNSFNLTYSGQGAMAIGTNTPTANYLLTMNAHGTNTKRGAIDITMTSTGSNTSGIQITSNTQNARGFMYSNSSTGLTNAFWGVGSELTGTNVASGYLGYRNGSGKTYGLWAMSGTTSSYTSGNVNVYAALIQGRAAITSESTPTSPLDVDLEVRNTTAGAANPATVSMRQTTSITAANGVMTNLNFGDNNTTSPQAQMQVVRGALSSGATDLPTDFVFSTTADNTTTLAEKMRLTNAGNLGIGTNNPTQRLQVEVSPASAGLNLPLYVRNTNNTNGSGNAVGIGFVNEGANTAIKAAMVHERLNNFGVGTLHFLVNNDAASSSSVNLTQSRMSITSAGVVRVNNLSAGGNRIVQVDNNGDLFASNTLPTGSNNYIQNQYAAQQTATSEFWISGRGRMDGGLTVGAGATLDNNNTNTGTVAAGALAFGSASGEGIGSKRNAGGNQYGLDFYTASTNRMAITNGGRVGINNSAPGNPLHVVGVNATEFDVARFDGSNTIGAGAMLNSTAAGGRNWGLISTANSAGEGAGKLLFKDNTGGNVRMTLQSDGNVGIGTSSPQGVLHISTALTANTVKIHNPTLANGSLVGMEFGKANSNNNMVEFRYNHISDGNSGNWVNLGLWGNANTLNVLGSGNVGIGTTTVNNRLHIAAAEGQGIDIGVANDAMGLDGGNNAIRFYGYRDVRNNFIGAKITSERTNACCGWLSQGNDLVFHTLAAQPDAAPVNPATPSDYTTERMRITSSGAILGNFRHITHHNFNVPSPNWYNPGANGQAWFPSAGGEGEDDATQNGAPWQSKNQGFVAPYNGRLAKVIVRVDNSSSNGGTELRGRVCMAVNGGGVSNVDPMLDLNENQTGTVIVPQGQAGFSFNAGDIINVGINVGDSQGGCPGGDCYIEDNDYFVICVWEYNIQN